MVIRTLQAGDLRSHGITHAHSEKVFFKENRVRPLILREKILPFSIRSHTWGGFSDFSRWVRMSRRESADFPSPRVFNQGKSGLHSKLVRNECSGIQQAISRYPAGRGEMPQIIDLSMEVHRFMQTYPGTASPLIRVLEDHYESAARIPDGPSRNDP